VIVVDMVKDFVHGKLKTDRAPRIIPNIRELLQAARRTDRAAVFVGDAHLPSDPEIDVWGEHAMRGTEGAETIDELKPEPSDTVLEKRTHSAFHETGLDSLLRNLGVDKVVVVGLHTNICDRHTAADAFFRGYKVVVPDDCVEAFSDEDHRSGLEYLKTVYGARVVGSGKLTREWGATASVRESVQ
jgi:nicotinamidase-related amidase